MARRQAIEAEELFETANRMAAEGKKVTAVALHDALGGGSLRTIYKYLEAWQAAKPAVVVTTDEEIPPGVQIAFDSAWRAARQEAGRQVVEVKEKAKEEVAAALAQFHGALEAIERIEKDREAAASQSSQSTNSLSFIKIQLLKKNLSFPPTKNKAAPGAVLR